MVNVYAPDDEDQEWEIGGGHVDRYHECMKVTKMMMEKQADFALELA